MLIRADARALPLVDACVQCVVTSPPFWGLRDYGDPGQLGQEVTPWAYTAALVAVFREVRRVLKPDGVVWLNLGDCYAGDRAARTSTVSRRRDDAAIPRSDVRVDGLKPKDLVGVPWAVAFALRDDGWYLRADTVWSKPNPMPESVTDRPTRAHEYLFLLTKRPQYYYDAAAIFEPYAESTLREVEQEYRGEGLKDYEAAGVQNPSDVKRRIVNKLRTRTTRPGVDTNGGNQASGAMPTIGAVAGRNKRSVWTIPTQPYREAHFAAFPTALVEPCILAGSRPGDLVCDPFVGTGTVGQVADRLFRRWVGVDLQYHDLAKRRTVQRGLRWEDEYGEGKAGPADTGEATSTGQEAHGEDLDDEAEADRTAADGLA